MVPCVTWSLLELARRPDLAERLATSVSRYNPSSGAIYNVHDVTNTPSMKSLLMETVRLRTAPIEVLLKHKGVALDDNWKVRKDIPVIAFVHQVALDSQESRKLLSNMAKKPLEEYWPERYLEQSKSLKPESNSAETPHGVVGFDMQNSSLGRGRLPLLGHEYFPAAHAATMAIFLNDFELQLCDPELFDAVLPPARELAFGILKPLDKVEARIRKRTTSNTK